MSRRSEREILLENLKRDVSFLAQKRAMQALDDVLVYGAGYCSATDTWPPAEELLAVLMAIANVVSLPSLRDMAGQAAFGAAYHRKRGAKWKEPQWEDARRASDRARLLPRLQAANSKRSQPARRAA